MCGCESRANTCPSRVNRSANPGIAASDFGSTFNATTRFSRGCRARNTALIPPRPINSSTSKSGNACATSSKLGKSDRTSGTVSLSPSPCATNSSSSSGFNPCRGSDGDEVDVMVPAP